MPITLFHSGVYELDSGSVPGYAYLKYSVTATYDANGGVYISSTSEKWYVSDSLNYDSINYTTKYWKIINGGKSLHAYASGTASFSWTDPNTNLKFQSTRPFASSHVFNG